MLEKWRAEWNRVDKPEKERIYLKGKPQLVAVFFLASYAIALVTVFLLDKWEQILAKDPITSRYEFEAWAPSYFLYFFMMTIPIIVAMTINSKSKTPAYGFGSIIGSFCAALTYIIVNPWFGIYMAFAVSLALLGNAMSQGDFSIQKKHLIYYFFLGAYACFGNTVFQMIAWDVWVWLQMIHLHLFSVIISSVKMRQWAYMFMLGWAVYAIYSLIVPNLLILRYFDVFYLANLNWAGWYNLLVPPILSLTIFYYFFVIQRRVKSGHIGMDK